MSEKTPSAEFEEGKEAQPEGQVTDNSDTEKVTEETQAGSESPESDSEQSQSEGNISDSGGSAPNGPVEPARRGVTAKHIGLMVLLIVLFLLLGGGYWQWLTQQKGNTQLVQRLEDMSRRLQNSESQLSQLSSQMQNELEASAKTYNQSLQSLQDQQTSLSDNIDQLQRQNEQLRQRIDAQQKRLQSLTTTSREDWLLAEAEYLLKLANQRVMLERAPQNAIALLEAADNLIRQVAAGTGDAELFAVRKALAEELAALKLVPTLDKEGVYLRLQALAGRVDQLPRVPATQLQSGKATSAQPDSGSSTGEQGTDDSWWKAVWRDMKDMLGVLDNYIRIDDAKTPESALISGHAAQMAALNIRIAVEQAQVALLKEEQQAFQSALRKADQLIGEYFVDSEAAQRFREDLQSLLSLPVAAELPDISESLQLLQAYLEQLHKLTPQREGQL